MRFFRRISIQSVMPFVLVVLLASSLGCRKKTAPAPEAQTPPKVEVPEIVLPVAQLEGLKINDQEVEQIAALSEEPQSLTGSDLAQAFKIEDKAYQEQSLKLIQSQLQSGSPLKDVLVYLGRLPKKYAAQCASLEAEPLEKETCLIEPLAFYCREALATQNWTPANYQALCQSLGRFKAYNPNYLVALFDGDNTLWYQDVSNAGVKRGVDSKRIQWAPGKAELLPVYPKVEERESYLKTKTPYDYYQELYKAVGPLWNYNYAALAFRGLSLKETFANFQELQKESYGPIAFPEMQALITYLNKEGIITGVVSASPLFGVIPMVESMNTGIPLSRIEGLDVFIQNPAQADALPVRMSRLINQGKYNETTGQVEAFKNYQEVLEEYGDWVIVDVDHIINARGGKGVQSRSIIRRHVAEKNLETSDPKAQMDLEDMRLVLVGGDNFAPATDILNPEGDRNKAALEGGNDQGLSEGMNFLAKTEQAGFVPGGTDLLFVSRQVLTAEGLIEPKAGKLENFQAYAAQQKLLRPHSLGQLIIQPAVTDVKAAEGKGGFLQTPPPAPAAPTPPETSPGEEAKPEETSGETPSTETKPEPEMKSAPSPQEGAPSETPTPEQAPETAPSINPNPEAEAIEAKPEPALPKPQAVEPPKGNNAAENDAE